MSLTSIIRGTDTNQISVKQAIQLVSPPRSLFKTQSEINPFSKYEFLTQYNLQNNFQSTVVGVAFDYMVKINTSLATNTKTSSEIFLNLAISILLGDKKPVLVAINKLLEQVDDLIANQPSDYVFDKDLITGICIFAKLENLWRSGGLVSATTEEILKPIDDIVYEELWSLIDTYKKVFLESGLISHDSLITYKPVYSTTISLAVGGIEPDLVIDGTIFDLKTTKRNGYIGQDAMQITGYYLFYLLDRLLGSKANILEHKIERIAFYKARFGQIEYVNVSDLDKDNVIQALIEINQFYNFGIKNNTIKELKL